jgi:hypothetical protein
VQKAELIIKANKIEVTGSNPANTEGEINVSGD